THVAYNAYMLALAAFNKAEYAPAVEQLRLSLDFNPAVRDAWLLLGKSQMNLKEYAAAAEAFGGAVGVSLGEQRYEPLSLQGQAQLYADQAEAAHATFSVLIDEGVIGYEAYGWRAYANLKRGRIDDAERDFQVAVQRTNSREKRAEYDAALKEIAESR
ncbi:MAG: hypothetical protein H6841_08105, partial [Planctomycetes bacterium]|nr:hypothetical protein [Planctomycetota bacterium]